MLSDDAKIVIEFLDECRNQLALKDPLHEKLEAMYSSLYQLEYLLRGDKDKMKVFLELETLVVETLNLTKDTYFEYGDNFAQVRESRFWKRMKQEAE